MRGLEVTILSVKDKVVTFSFVVDSVKYISSAKVDLVTVCKPSIREVWQIEGLESLRCSMRHCLHFTESRFLIKELNEQLRK